MSNEAKIEAYRICRKWVDAIGIGFHPDTLAMHYEPALSNEQQLEYTLDMMMLFLMEQEEGIDPYEAGLDAMAAAGLTTGAN